MHTDGKFVLLARSGYAARGAVYIIIAAMALVSVFGGGGNVGSQGALSSLLAQPLGWMLLCLVGVGLAGHALWRLAQSLLNADGHGQDAKGYLIRAGLLASGLTHGLLAVNAFQIALAGGGGDSSGGETGVTAWLMQQPFGRYLVGAAGLAILGAGAAQLYKGFSGGFDKWLAIPSRRLPAVFAICAAGLSARGLIFLIVGVFFLYAAFTVDPQQAGGLADALAWVRGLPFGAWLYGMTALGLLAFGGYSIIEALYRRMDASEINAGRRKIAAAAK